MSHLAFDHTLRTLRSATTRWDAHLTRAGLVMAAALGLSTPATAQRPTGAQPVQGIRGPVSLPTYAIEVQIVEPVEKCTPAAGVAINLRMLMRNTGTTTAANVPWKVVLNNLRTRSSTAVNVQATIRNAGSACLTPRR